MKLIGISAFAMLLGCGHSTDLPETADVEGVVTYQGQPLSSASVIFSPESGPIAMGVTDQNGVFHLKTQGSDGAKIGNHQVTVQAMGIPGGGAVTSVDPKTGRDLTVKMVSQIPEKYGIVGESGLTAVVERKKQNEFRFDLK
ncbi:transthyretin-like family protein [Planctomicrobium piriforme]|nr:carboxypeptidase-like regulatory domain-containing protein [Planctomicrobium piriforme]